MTSPCRSSTFEGLATFIEYTQAMTGRVVIHLWERIEALEAKVAELSR